jgi:hypothetical protein
VQKLAKRCAGLKLEGAGKIGAPTSTYFTRTFQLQPGTTFSQLLHSMTMCKKEPFKFRDGTMRGRTSISNTPGTGAPSDSCRMNLLSEGAPVPGEFEIKVRTLAIAGLGHVARDLTDVGGQLPDSRH